MIRAVLPILTFLFCTKAIPVHAQTPGTDTFFLVKKKGWLGKLGKSISADPVIDSGPVIKANPYIPFKGKVIRHIKIVRLGFERDVNDTTRYHNSFGAIAANAFHKKTTAHVIANNLFFDAGDRLNPYLMADNEKFLRDQAYLQDALLLVEPVEGNPYMVDVLVMVKDVFSLGGGANISSLSLMSFDIKEENLRGSGTKLQLMALYDAERRPRTGFGAELLKRNLGGSFINVTAGFKSFYDAVISDRSEETRLYVALDKPFITPYMHWVGGISWAYNHTKNNYVPDSLYERTFRYSYQRADGWLGYTFGSSSHQWKKQDGRTKALIALRGLWQHFDHLPLKAKDTFDYRLANVGGLLTSISVFRQNFTRADFIYGFGRNEDLPEGFDLSLVAGWVGRQDSAGAQLSGRPYYALDGQRTHLNKKGFFSSFTLRIGGYVKDGKIEDADILAGVEHFTRKKKIRPQWYYRQFYSFSFTRQLNTSQLQQPLFLNSVFGLPYFDNGNIRADMRATVKAESVFYNLRSFWGFRLAPFVFTDLCLVKEAGSSLQKSDLYAALGAGIRTRNESLVFGTLELKAFYFPRTVGDMSNFRVQLGSNIRFRYNNVLVKKPDFIIAN